MRILIAAAFLACAAAAPSGLLGHGYIGHAAPLGLAPAHLAYGHGAPLGYAAAAPLAVAHAAPALPTISPGDLQGAAIDAHVEVSDHVRASADAAREYHDQASELHGQAVNAAEDHSWQAVDAVKTVEAQLDGQAAGVAPILAKQLAGHAALAPAPLLAAGHGYAAPALGYAAHGGLGYAAHGGLGYAAHGGLGYAAPALAASKTVVSQSLSQSHPAPLLHAPVLAHAGPAAYAHGYGAHGYAAHGLAHGW